MRETAPTHHDPDGADLDTDGDSLSERSSTIDGDEEDEYVLI